MDKNIRAKSQETLMEPKRPPLLIDFARRMLKEKPLGTLGGIIFLMLLLVGIFADVLAPYGMNEMIPYDRLSAPSAVHLLGADNVGRDLFSRIIYGARISMIVGLAGSLLDMLVATIIGTISGFFGGKTDIIIQRFVDAFQCFPSLVLYMTFMSVVGPGLLQVVLVLGIVSGIRSSRVVRSAAIGVKENVYIEAARAIGAPTKIILTRHVLPNIMAPIIVVFTVAVGRMIIQEASLSFLGLGIPPPDPSWGGMLSGSGRRYMLQAPWMVLWPGLSLAIVVYGINMLGDAVRDLLDPKLRGGLGRYGKVSQAKLRKMVKAEKAK